MQGVVNQQVQINQIYTLLWCQMMVLVRASPGLERGATLPSVALPMTDLKSLVVGTCILVLQCTHNQLLNRNHNKVPNRTLPAQMLVLTLCLIPNKMDQVPLHLITMYHHKQKLVRKHNKRKKLGKIPELLLKLLL